MVKKQQRLQELTKLLEIHNVLTINELSTLLEVSHMTVRRDLQELSARNMVSLIHGGAALSPYYGRKDESGEYELPAAKTARIREKMRIGLKAAGSSYSPDSSFLP